MSSTEEGELEFNLGEDDESAVDYDSERDTSGRTDALAKLTEEQENRVQMDEIRRMTVEPGLMQLPVGNVMTAENSEKWVLEIEHPVEGTHRFFYDKPIEGYSTDYKIVRLMKWYGVESGSPYDLRFHRMYVRKDPEASNWAHGWVLERPKSYDPPITQQLVEMWDSVSVDLSRYRPNFKASTMYLFLIVGVTIAPLFYGSVGVFGELISQMVTGLIVFAFMTIAGLTVLDL